jgi:hypothetical protein
MASGANTTTGAPGSPFCKKSSNNWTFSLAGDKQLTMPNRYIPIDGIYVGGTVQYAPPQQNVYSQYYEGRVYAFGLIPKRPVDMAILMIDRTSFSNSFLNAIQQLPTAIGRYVTGALESTGLTPSSPQWSTYYNAGVQAIEMGVANGMGSKYWAGRFGVPTSSSSTSVNASYYIHWMHGTGLNLGVGYTKNPTFAPRMKAAVNGEVSLIQFF